MEYGRLLGENLVMPERIDGLKDANVDNIAIELLFGQPVGHIECLPTYPEKYEPTGGYRPCVVHGRIRVEMSGGGGHIMQQIEKARAVSVPRHEKPEVEDIKNIVDDIGKAVSEVVSDLLMEVEKCLRQQST